ncbi:MAG: hypothetical protein E7569_08860 [Ruminococcaceae bacterium]|jgi:hypothetical protein|nr:hypothetical protein [Oscillospiraceae bacterium]
MSDILSFLKKEMELLSTFQPEVYANAVKTLKEKGILYRIKTTYTGYGNRGTGRIGSIGERVELETQYQIFVKKDDYESAKHLLNL